MGSDEVSAVLRSPLADWQDSFAEASRPGVIELSELPFLAQLNLRIDPRDGELCSLVSDTLGIDLPREPNTVHEAPGQAALWLGPDEWLLVGAPGSQRPTMERLGQALEGRHHSLVDVTANRAVLQLAGRRAREVLATGCAFDLHPLAFGSGRCAQTLVSRAQIVLWQVDDRPAFRLFVRPSFGPYLAAWLLDAATEYVTVG